MQEIIEHYGMALLEMIAVSLGVVILLECYKQDSVLSNMILGYFRELCG